MCLQVRVHVAVLCGYFHFLVGEKEMKREENKQLLHHSYLASALPCPLLYELGTLVVLLFKSLFPQL
jgi:hypothetical protein